MQPLTQQLEQLSLQTTPKQIVSQLKRATNLTEIEGIWNKNKSLFNPYVICAYLDAHIKVRKKASKACHGPVLEHARKILSEFRTDSLVIFANTLRHLGAQGKEYFTDIEALLAKDQLKKLESRHLTLLVDATVTLSKFPKALLETIADIFIEETSRFSKLQPKDFAHASQIFTSLESSRQKCFFINFEKALCVNTLVPWQAAKIIDQIADLDNYTDSLLETLLAYSAEHLSEFDAEELANIKETILYRKKHEALLEKIAPHICPKYDALSWRVRQLAAYSGIAPIPETLLHYITVRLKENENWKTLSLNDLALCTICFVNRNDVDHTLFQSIREKLFKRQSLFQLQKRKLFLLQKNVVEHLQKSEKWSSNTWETVALLAAASKEKEATKLLFDRLDTELGFTIPFMSIHAFENGGIYRSTLPASDSFEENLLIVYLSHHEKAPELFSSITLKYLQEIWRKRMLRHPLERHL